MAAIHLDPAIQAAMTSMAFSAPRDVQAIDPQAFIDELDRQSEGVQAGSLARAEKMLITQAHALNAVFGSLARKAALGVDAEFGMDAAETLLRLALKAQSQCRATLETLVLVKNPPAVAFVKQANIANGPQQVNNGTPPDPGRARVPGNLSANQLLEARNGERLDTGPTGKASEAHSTVEAVGALNGSEDWPRQGGKRAERHETRHAINGGPPQHAEHTRAGQCS